MDLMKCNACGWVGGIMETETHFYGEHEIPICPMCYSENLEDVEMEDEENSIPF